MSGALVLRRAWVLVACAALAAAAAWLLGPTEPPREKTVLAFVLRPNTDTPASVVPDSLRGTGGTSSPADPDHRPGHRDGQDPERRGETAGERGLYGRWLRAALVPRAWHGRHHRGGQRPEGRPPRPLGRVVLSGGHEVGRGLVQGLHAAIPRSGRRPIDRNERAGDSGRWASGPGRGALWPSPSLRRVQAQGPRLLGAGEDGSRCATGAVNHRCFPRLAGGAFDRRADDRKPARNASPAKTRGTVCG